MTISAEILVIRKDDQFSGQLRSGGFRVQNLPLIETVPIDDVPSLRAAVKDLESYDGIFITSRVAAEVFVNTWIHGHQRPEVYVVGSRAAEILQAAGWPVSIGNDANTAAELLGSLGLARLAGKRFLFVRGDKSLNRIPAMLDGIAELDHVVVYRTVDHPLEKEILNDIRGWLEQRSFDWICFFSPSAVERFVDVFGDVAAPKAAVIGRTTAARARDLGLDVRFVSHTSSASSFASGLIKHIDG
ncbi:MAG: uroporphyrinogen-III synthase [Pyrinomonadaceae bacterium]